MPLIETDTTIQQLFPHDIVTEETTGCKHGEILYAQEKVYVSRAYTKRREEFISGRMCARQALAQMGIHSFPLQKRPSGDPIWPTGIVGCITHTLDYCGVAIGSNRHYLGIGLDAERIVPLETKLQHYICVAEELNWLYTLPVKKHQIYLLLIFSAKECLFKCQFPVTSQWLDFHDIKINIIPERDEFEAISVCIGHPYARHFIGRYLISEDYVFTGIAWRHSPVSGE